MIPVGTVLSLLGRQLTGLVRHPWAIVALLVAVVATREACHQRATVQLRRQIRTEQLGAQNARADADSARQILPGLYQRLAHQASAIADLEGRPARVVTRTVTDTVVKTDTSTAQVETLPTGELVTESAIDSGPAHAAARVTIAGPLATWDWRLTIDPIPIEISVRCEDAGPVTLVQLPPALPVGEHRATLADDVCLPPIAGGGGWFWKVGFVASTAGLIASLVF